MSKNSAWILKKCKKESVRKKQYTVYKWIDKGNKTSSQAS